MYQFITCEQPTRKCQEGRKVGFFQQMTFDMQFDEVSIYSEQEFKNLNS